MRNMREEARIFISKAEQVARNTETITETAVQLLELDMILPQIENQEPLAMYAMQLDIASEAAFVTGTSAGPDLVNHVDLWSNVLSAQVDALNAGKRASAYAKLIRCWLV